MPLLLDVFGLGGLPSQKGPATLRTWALAVEFLPLGVVEFLPPVLLIKGVSTVFLRCPNVSGGCS